ncbi:hypothetical protein [Janibacter cremeus]|uniref:Uncharacterized protein n=1 Tax=Janibacter cremeus TaxID=1285192 RepID=A0A852VT19_9MICO|nr:hypothetical protein [Janibacter cremeus]NYF97813.1 hypothetical protein [Janibacter cremeus]
MATSRLAAHLPSLFGTSRRAVWRLSLVRRSLAAVALLLALQLTLGAARPPETSREPATASGPALTLPLAAPAGHLEPGDAAEVYLPGRADPVVTGARVLATPVTSGAVPTVEVTLAARDVGQLVQQMAADVGGRTGFVVVRDG